MNTPFARRPGWHQSLLVGLSATALTVGVMTAAPAQAAPTAVTGATLNWTINDETGGGAHFGGCNFLSAGKAGNTGSSRQWTQADGFYAAASGNVSLAKPTASGDPTAPSWATKCQNAAGAAVTTAIGSTTGTVATFAAGQGSVDAATATAHLEWTGSLTVAYYGGLTYWFASNPVLDISDGNGTLKATLGGYGADPNDSSKWDVLTERPNVTLATFRNVTIGPAGFTAIPEYRGVAVTVPGTSQVRSGADWGAFPQDFIDFQVLTGQSSYWYSSGAGADSKKIAAPLTITWAGSGGPQPPQVTLSNSALPADASSDITITGSGFDPALTTAVNPPLAGKAGGVYVVFGKFPNDWRPSEGNNSTRRPVASQRWAVLAENVNQIGGLNAGAAVLNPDGSFTTTLTISQAAADSKNTGDGTYGIYTYAAGGAVYAPFETFSPISFLTGGDLPISVTVPVLDGTQPPPTGEFKWTISSSAAVVMGTATEGAAAFAASGALPEITVTDTRSNAPAWSVSGQVSDFFGGTKKFDGAALGWVPRLTNNTVGAQAGALVTANAPGLKAQAHTLAAAPTGHNPGQVTVNAQLNLLIPLDTAAGDYTGVLTLTAVG